MKHPVRFFSIGLITSALLFFIYSTMFDTVHEPLEEISTEDLITEIEDSGYRVISDEEFISYSLYLEEKHEQEKEVESKSNDKQQQDDGKKNEKSEVEKEKGEKKKKEKQKDSKEVTFTISEGDVSEDIAEILEKNDIIDDREAFINYLEDNDYSKYIQLGSFKVTTEMSLKDIAKVITTYPGE